jgi:lysozyme
VRKINDAGLALIKSFEGFSARVYLDPVHLATVGWGHLVRADDGLKVGDFITADRAMRLLVDDLAAAETAVETLVHVPLSDNQFAALVSFTFNLGATAFANSTLYRLVNEGDMEGAAEQFSHSNHAGGKVVSGLTRRRAAERALFESTN